MLLVEYTDDFIPQSKRKWRTNHTKDASMSKEFIEVIILKPFGKIIPEMTTETGNAKLLPNYV